MGRVIPFPPRQFFEVHGSKFKLHPVCHLSQASVLRITHGVFFFRIRKVLFNRFFAFLVKILVLRRISGIICQFLIFFPDMTLYRLYAILGMGTELSGRAIGADLWVALVFPVSIPVGGAVFQSLVFGANDAVVKLIIDIFPPLVSTLPCLRTLIGCGENSAIAKYFLANMRSLVSGICNNGFDSGNAFVTLSYTLSKATLSCTLPGVTTVSSTKPWLSQAVWAS